MEEIFYNNKKEEGRTSKLQKQDCNYRSDGKNGEGNENIKTGLDICWCKWMGSFQQIE